MIAECYAGSALRKFQAFFLPNGTTFGNNKAGKGKSADKAPCIGALVEDVVQGGDHDTASIAQQICDRYTACVPAHMLPCNTPRTRVTQQRCVLIQRRAMPAHQRAYAATRMRLKAYCYLMIAIVSYA